MILVQRGEHRGDDALAERVVEGVVDRGGQDAEARRDLAVDRDVEHRPGIFLVGGHVGDLRHAPELVRKIAAQWSSSLGVRVGQRVLVLRLAIAGADRDVLRRLHIERDALDLARVAAAAARSPARR